MARMSVFGFWALILLAGTACLSSTYSSSHDLNFPRTEDSIAATTSFKEPKEGCYSQHISSEEIQKDNINMEGYSKIDPTPKSTATIVIQTNRAWHSSHTLHSRTSTAGSPEARQVQTTSFACLTILSPAKNKSLHQTW